jgi:sugar-specific transcriptional regulator TrmB
MIEKELEEIGLRKNEAKIYFTLLRIGTATPSQIAKATALSRSYIYDALENLREKDLVGSQIKNGKMHYVASDPKQLEESAEEKLAKTKKILLKLQKTMEAVVTASEVLVYEGKYIYKALLRDITGTLKKGDAILIFGIDDEKIMQLDKYYESYLDLYFALLKKKKISERVIVRKGTKKFKQAKTTKYRFLNEEFFGDVAFEVYGDRLAIFEWGEQSRLILIRNAKIAEAYRKQFEILWNFAR